MLAVDPDEVRWGERAISAATGTPLEDRARLNLGSSLTNEPGRRHEGHAILARHRSRPQLRQLPPCAGAEQPPVRSRLCRAAARRGPDHRRVRTARGRYGVDVKLHGGGSPLPGAVRRAARRPPTRPDRGLAWFGPVDPEPHTCLAGAVALLELDSGQRTVQCVEQLLPSPTVCVTESTGRSRDRDNDAVVVADRGV